MSQLKHGIAEQTCGNCAYWNGIRLTDKKSGVSFINPNEIAECQNKQSPKAHMEVAPSNSCELWKSAT